MIDVLQRMLAVAPLALLVAIVVVIAASGTTAGTARVLAALQEATAGDIVAGSPSGTLLSGLRLGRLTIRAGAVTIEALDAELALFWPDLLRRRITLRDPAARQVSIRYVADASGTRGPGAPVLLPYAISVRRLGMDSVRVETGTTLVELADVELTGTFIQGVINVEAGRFSYADLPVKVAGTLGSGRPYAVEATVDWSLPASGVSGSGSVVGNLGRLRFVQQALVPEPVRLTGTLDFGAGGPPELVAEARWAEIIRPLPLQGLFAGPLVSRGGLLRVRGTTAAYRAELGGSVQLGKAPAGLLRIAADGDLAELRIRESSLEAYGGLVTATGSVRIGDVVAGDLRVGAAGLDPGLLDARARGRLDAEAAVRFDTAGNFAVDLSQARGRIGGQAFAASGRLERGAGALRFDAVRIEAGSNSLRLDGSWGKEIRGRFTLDAPDLATLRPGARGQLAGRGTLSGSPGEPLADLDLTGAGIELDTLRVARLAVRGRLSRRDAIEFTATAGGIAAAGRPLGDLQAMVSGTLGAHAVDASLSGGQVALTLNSRGGWADGTWRQQLDSGALALADGAWWKSRDPPSITISRAGASIAAHCWTDGEAELCPGEFSLAGPVASGSLSARRLPLGELGSLVSADLELRGRADVELDFRRDGKSLTGRLGIAPTDLQLLYRTADGEELTTTFEEFLLRADATGTETAFTVRLADKFGLAVNGTGTVSDLLGDAPTVNGSVRGQIPDLRRLAPLLERFGAIGDVAGRADLDAQFSGPLAAPLITGGIELADGTLTVPAAGITVDRISLRLAGGSGGRATLTGGARSGQGFAAIEGDLRWQDSLVPDGEFTVKGRRVEAIRLPGSSVLVSPNLRVLLAGSQLRVSGSVDVPKARVTLREIGKSAVAPSPDTVVEGRDVAAAGEASPPFFMLDGLVVSLGNDVAFSGFGLDTGLTGRLTLDQGIARDPRAVVGDGVVRLRDGTFAALGRKLRIDRGSLLFAGLVTEPSVDVRAIREITYEGRDITVGLLLSGNITRIQTQVFSEPAMGEMDVLSYLTTGQPLAAAGAGARQSVTSAAIGLGLSSALPVAQQLGSTLRVDEVGIESGDAAGTSVVVGERIGNDLYVRYSYGVFNSIGTVRATYRISRRLSIEGSSGDANSLDLIYSINW